MKILLFILSILLFSISTYAQELNIDKLPVDLRSYASWNSYPNITVKVGLTECFLPPYAKYAVTVPKGIHKDKFLSVFINSIGEKVVGNLRKLSFPQGSAIVKEKKSSIDMPAHAAGVMLKREKGFDDTVGDWEFMYLSETGDFTRGKEKTSSCSSCHRKASQTDFVFGNYANKR